jgi:dTDP-4-amino-4,6-dideoxygalactose transaminase
MNIPVALPKLGEAEAAAAREVILSGWVTQGPQVKRFEERFSDYVQAPYSCALSNCTTALHLALLAIGVRPGDVVLTVSHSFIATANAIRSCQAEPVFVDIDLDTFNMSPESLEKALQNDFTNKSGSLWYNKVEHLLQGESPFVGRSHVSGRLAAILVVHQGGMPADLKKILNVARQFQVPVIEDAACAAGSEISLDNGTTWAKIGKPHGEMACFSFHPRKVITTGDGGMITSSKSEYDASHRLFRQHGMSTSDLSRHQSNQVIFEEYETTAFNYRMTDIQAAVGIEQLNRLPQLVAERRILASQYFDLLSSNHKVILPREPAFARTNWQTFIIRIESAERQRDVMQALQDRGISTRRGIMCIHLEKPYRAAWKQSSLKNSELARDTGIVLPLFPGMTEAQLAYVVENLLQVTRKLL